ncbi:MAG: hypothetical protein ACI9R3_002373 [Verrucomicrobiales bacterium]|jgi:hypothetical protein
MRTTISILTSILFSLHGIALGEDFEREFTETVLPFVNQYCASCHGAEKQKGKFDLSPYQSLDSVTSDFGHWDLVLERLQAGEMPPEDAEKHPEDDVRQQLVQWIERVRRFEADRNAGDPGSVLARRLSNAEYDYSIHDLTGIDIRPTKEFPIDPANKAGFDNTGESLTLSPALLSKYLAAARHVSDHLLFLPDGLAFAPHPVVVYSDRDKYCVHRIIEFYNDQPTDLVDYFRAAWHFRHQPKLTLEEIAQSESVSAQYLRTLWDILTDTENDTGPIAELRKQWNTVSSETDCENLRDFVIAERTKLIPTPRENFKIKGLHSSHQAIILWKDRELAALRRIGKLPEPDGTDETDQLRKATTRFCQVFPDAFYVSERGRMFLPPEKRNKGRHLSAGFHMMLGYFRDDAPLYDLILDTEARKELDTMWNELEFLPRTPERQFADFVYLERGEAPAFLQSEEFAFARQDADVTSEEKMSRLAKLYMAKVREVGIAEKVHPIIEGYFRDMSGRVRQLEKHESLAQPHHLEDLMTFAERAWQGPLSQEERLDLLGFYEFQKQDGELSHEDAVRDVLTSVLVSPKFFFRTTEAEPGSEATPLSDHQLASRLSYFLWSSLPDAELLERARAGNLHEPETLLQQTRRLLEHPQARRLAVEFGGNWLDFRRFESHNGVNRERFPAFTDELRQAMFEEPVRFFTDLAQSNGSVLDFLEGTHTFVNPVLAKHYGLPATDQAWQRVENVDKIGRGGLLPMGVFLTANSPGLRTSPVKRGYWVVRRLLGERIPAPPPQVPELPEDESKLGPLSLRETLARHREDKSCATCHDSFDSIGLVFEGYGPTGERRETDLGNRPINTAAEFPNGVQGEGLDGLRQYVREHRRPEFIDTLCRKLYSYALGRSLLLSDESAIEKMKSDLAENDYRFHTLVEAIVTSPQFLRKRGRDHQTPSRNE